MKGATVVQMYFFWLSTCIAKIYVFFTLKKQNLPNIFLMFHQSFSPLPTWFTNQK